MWLRKCPSELSVRSHFPEWVLTVIECLFLHLWIWAYWVFSFILLKIVYDILYTFEDQTILTFLGWCWSSLIPPLFLLASSPNGPVNSLVLFQFLSDLWIILLSHSTQCFLSLAQSSELSSPSQCTNFTTLLSITFSLNKFSWGEGYILILYTLPLPTTVPTICPFIALINCNHLFNLLSF